MGMQVDKRAPCIASTASTDCLFLANMALLMPTSCIPLANSKVIRVYFGIIMTCHNMNLCKLHKHSILRYTGLYCWNKT
jgi:hypothetical protein